MFGLLFRKAILLLVLALLLGAGLWVAGMLLGIMPRAGWMESKTQNRITITTFPEMANVSVNGTALGTAPVTIKNPDRQFLLKVDKEGYEAYERKLDGSPPDHIHISLTYQPSVESIAESAHAPAWDLSGNLVYFDDYRGALIFDSAAGTKEIPISLCSTVTNLDFSPTGDLIGLCAGAAYDVIILANPITQKLEVVGFSGTAPAWHPSGSQFFFVGWSSETFGGELHLWAGKADTAPARIPLPGKEKITIPVALAWSQDGRYLMVQSYGHADVWLFSEGKFEFSQSLATRLARWAPSGHILAYLDDSSTLMLYNAEENKAMQLLENQPYEDMRWTSDGARLLGATYDAGIGGSTFWSMDVAKKSAQLLVSGEDVFGKVTQFAVAPVGSQLVCLNDLGRLSLITFGE